MIISHRRASAPACADLTAAGAGPASRPRLGLMVCFARFAVVGVTSTALTSGALWLLQGGLGVPLPLAATLAYGLGIVYNFRANNAWTFSRSGWTWPTFTRFGVVALGGLTLNVATLTGLNGRLHIHLLEANVAAVAVSMWWNFWANRLWTWSAVSPHLGAVDTAA